MKHRRIVILLIILNFLFSGSVLGQTLLQDTAAESDSDIFPFASEYSEVQYNEVSDADDAERYTEDLIDISDDGVYDPQGRILEYVNMDFSEDDTIYVDDSAFEAMRHTLGENSEHSVFEEYKESIIANWGGKLAFTKKRLEDIKGDIEKEMVNFELLDKEVVDIELKMEPLRRQVKTLTDEIDLLNRQLNLAQTKIRNAEMQIAEKQIMLKNLMGDAERSRIELDAQTEIALDYIMLVYQEEEKFLDYYSKSSSALKLLLADNSVSENLLGLEYSVILEQSGRKVFYDLYYRKKELEDKQARIEKEKSELDRLYMSLDQEKRLLAEGKLAKKNLLEQTKGEEEEYQRLLDESIKQQLESAIAIQNMRDNVEFIEQKLNLLDSSLSKVGSMAEEDSIGYKKEDVELIHDEIQKEFSPEPVLDAIPDIQPFIWPVPPVAVTAYFHDPTYPKRWGVHKAIDLRARQFTEIMAPANGYVFQAKDNGMGYSYIILAHKNKLITVYGHVSEILVKTGSVVKQGDVIGLTGGTPGTKGAGWQTTGPHLHFEVWHNGDQVDPLDWLPIMDLPIEYIPDKFLAIEKPVAVLQD